MRTQRETWEILKLRQVLNSVLISISRVPSDCGMYILAKYSGPNYICVGVYRRIYSVGLRTCLVRNPLLDLQNTFDRI